MEKPTVILLLAASAVVFCIIYDNGYSLLWIVAYITYM